MNVKYRVLTLGLSVGLLLPKQLFCALGPMQQPAPRADGPVAHANPAIHIDQEYINSITRRIPEVLGRVNPEEIIDRVTREQEERERAKQEALDAAIQNQNTLLVSATLDVPNIFERDWEVDAQGNMIRDQHGNWQWHHPRVRLPIGLYKRDLIEGGFLAAQVAGEAAVNKKVQECTQQHALATLQKDYQALIELLEKYQQAQADFDDKYHAMSALKRMFTSTAQQKALLFKPVRDYLHKHHTYIHKNIFKQELLPALMGLLVGHKAAHVLKDKLIAHNGIPYVLQPGYEKQADGSLRMLGVDQEGTIDPTNPAPLSALNILKFVASPVNFYKEIVNAWVGTIYSVLMPSAVQQRPLNEAEVQDRTLSQLNKFFGLGVPSWLYSKGARAVGEALALGYAAKIHSNIATAFWIQHVEKNHAELLTLLRDYKAAYEMQDTIAREKSEVALKQFIKKGHTISRLPWVALYQWWTQRDASQKMVSMLKGLPIYGILGWKAYKLYKDF